MEPFEFFKSKFLQRSKDRLDKILSILDDPSKENINLKNFFGAIPAFLVLLPKVIPLLLDDFIESRK